MTFEEWFKGNSGFGGLTWKELFSEFFPKTDKDLKEALEDSWDAAYEAGRKSLKDELIGETMGHWVEVHRDTLCEMVGEYNDF